MITEYRKTRNTQMYGLRADQPLATDVIEGTIYYVTDEQVLERSNGATWDDISASGASGAPSTAEYIVGALSGGLSAERLVTTTASISWDLSTAGQAKANVIPSVEQTTTSTGTQNNFDLNGRNTVLRCNNASLLTLTGFTVLTAAPQAGDRVTVISINAQVNFSHQTGSTAANQLFNFVTSGPTPILLGSAVFVYDGTTSRWRLVNHIQGNWITPTFAAGNFTASGAMTWTVDAGDVAIQKYKVEGNTFTMALTVNTSSVGGVVASGLQVAVPNGYTTASDASNFLRVNDNGTFFISYCFYSSGNLVCRRDISSNFWTASANNTGVNTTAQTIIT